MKYMSERGMQVTMISSDGPELIKVLEREKCAHFIVPMTRRISPHQDLIALWLLYRLIKKENPEIVHSHTPKAGLLSMLAAKLAGVKLRIHTVAGLRYVSEAGIKRRILILMERITLRFATHVWVNGPSLKRKLIEENLVPERKIDMVGYGSSNGVDITRFSISKLLPEVESQVQTSFDYNNRYNYIICVGRIVGDKGINELVDVFGELYNHDNSLRLILVGDFEDEVDPVSIKTRNRINAGEGIMVTGWTDLVPYYMKLATFLVHPTHREGFPNVLLQAGAIGCPIVCSDIDGNIDIVTNESTGLIFNVSDASSLKSILLKALADPQAMRKYAERMKAHVIDNFEQKRYWQLLLEKYNSILKTA
jgi:glycosyltransferase involved in cell wall biosynthesis